MFAFKLVCEVYIKKKKRKSFIVGWINLGIERLYCGLLKVVPGYIYYFVSLIKLCLGVLY